MDDFANELLREAPSGVRAEDYGTAENGARLIQWWITSRYGVSFKVDPGCLWANAVEIQRDPGSRQGMHTYGDTRDVEGMGQAVAFARAVAAEYKPSHTF